jgi:hypothetical protein
MSALRIPVALLAVGLGATRAPAVTDDLQCFKVTNQNLKKLTAVVDLNAPSIGVAPGCKLTKAKLFCTPAETTVRAGTLRDGKRPGTALPFVGPPAEGARVCYGVKCKKHVGEAPDQVATDQFGTHQLARLTTSMLCRSVTASAGGPTESCGDGVRSGSEQCDGADVGGATCKSFGFFTGSLECTSGCTYDTSGCTPGFRVVSPDVEIVAGQEIVYCYYFRLPNVEPAAVKAWISHMPAPAKRLVLVLTDTDAQPPGTQSTQCQLLGGSTAVPEWSYAANERDVEFDFPSDDGTGTPVGQMIVPSQPAYLWIHYKNETTEPVTGHVELTGISYGTGRAVTRADSFVAENRALSLAPMSEYDCLPTDPCVRDSCPVPADAKFFSLTTHTNGLSTHTAVKDADSVLFQSTDPDHPGARTLGAPPFITFTSGQLTYECGYKNPTNRTIHPGESVTTDERCVALAFFFPSTGPKFCLDHVVIP